MQTNSHTHSIYFVFDVRDVGQVLIAINIAALIELSIVPAEMCQ